MTKKHQWLGWAIALLLVQPVLAQSSSTNYSIEESYIGPGGLIDSASANYQARASLGDTGVGNSESANFQIYGGYTTTSEEYLEFGVDGKTIDLGVLSDSATRAGTGTFYVRSYLAQGYAVTTTSDPPTSGGGATIQPMASQAAPTVGTEQFGINLKANTPLELYARVVGVPSTYTNNTTGTSNNVTLPSNIEVGDLLLMVYVTSNNTANQTITISVPSGWNSIVNGGDSTGSQRPRQMSAWRIADGTEGSTINVTQDLSGKAAATVYRLNNHDPATAPTGTITAGINPADPPLHDAGVSDDLLWMAVGSGVRGAGNAYSYSAGPTSYTDFINVGSTTGSGQNVAVGTAQRKRTAQTEDPGVLTATTSDGHVGATLAIFPDPVFGAEVLQIPDASFSFGYAATGYNTVDQFKYVKNDVVARSDSSSGRTTYTISYIANIALLTEAGLYTMEHSLVATPTF